MKVKEGKQLHDLSPHMRTTMNTRKIMQDVLIALTPALLASIYFFGYRSLILVLSSVTTCILSEYIWQKVRKEKITVNDYSAIVTGVLLAFNVPVTTPIWLLVIAAAFSIIVAKQFFGGIGNNFANPALMGRALIMFLWPGAISDYVTTLHLSTDAVSSATVLTMLKSGNEITYSKWDMFIGAVPGAIGEVSALFLLIGFAYLAYRKIVNVKSTFAYIGTVLLITVVFGPDGLFTGDILINLLSGGLILGACYMITDYPTISERLKVLLAVIAGVLTATIRVWGLLPEGVYFGILMANCLSGILDRLIKPHVYGVDVERQNS